MDRNIFILLTALCLVLGVSDLLAQAGDTLSSDRPGMTYSANTLGSRAIQFQLGGGMLQTATTRGFGYGYLGGFFDGVVRVGIIDRMEAGISIGYVKLENERGDRSRNAAVQEQLQLGINLRGNLLRSNGRTPSVGLLVEANFPDLMSGLVSERIYPKFLVLIEQPIARWIRLASNIGMTHTIAAQMNYTLNLNADVGKRVTVFVEHYGNYWSYYDRPTYNHTPKTHVWTARVNGGVAVLATPDLLLDLQGGYGGNVVPSETRSWNLELGLSWRIRFKPKVAKMPKN